MDSADSSSSCQNNNVIPCDYGTSDDKKSDSSRAPKFNGKSEEFFWWKTNMYSHIMGLDEDDDSPSYHIFRVFLIKF